MIDAIVVAAGSSTRMGGIDKVKALLGGVPVLCHCLRVFDESELVRRVVVVCRHPEIPSIRQLIAAQGFATNTLVVAGGDRRQDSVRSGLRATTDFGSGSEYVAVHDAARPFVTDELLKRGVDVAREFGAAVPGLPVADTLKRVDRGFVVGTLERESVYAVQTPQVFQTETLVAAHETVSEDVTDDGAMVEIAGGLVAVFEGDASNIKITTPQDLLNAEAMFAAKGATGSGNAEYRYGIGVDGHRLVDGGPLVIGGVTVEFAMHLEGHSDGDVLMHAIASAILGGAGAGDMGSNFPSTDDRYSGADSSLFVREAVRIAQRSGWSVDFADATVIAERPRLGPFRAAMNEKIGALLDLDSSRVNVKVTSSDGVGMIGEGRGIAAQAIATLRRVNG